MPSSDQSVDLVVDNFENRYRKVVPLVRLFTYYRQLWGAGILILFFILTAAFLMQIISGRHDRLFDQLPLLLSLLAGGIVVTFLLDLIARNPGKVFGALCMVFAALLLLLGLPGLLLGIESGAQIADNASSQSALLTTLLVAELLAAVLLYLHVMWVLARSAFNLVAASKSEAALFRDVPPGSPIIGGFFFRVLALPPILAFTRGRKLRFIVIVLLSLLAAFFTAIASIEIVSLPNLSLQMLIKTTQSCIESSGFDGRSYDGALYAKCTNAKAWPLLGVAFAGGLAFVLLLGLGSLLQRAVRRLVRLSLEQLQRTDERAPILFLRAFGDDQVPLRPEKASLFMRALEFGRRTKSLDQVLLEEGTPIGPVVALGNPTDKRPPYGAARGYFENKDWQEAVADLAHNSAAIVICLDDTQGVWWEVEHLATRGHVSKTLFLVHPKFSAPELNRRFLERVHKHFGADALFLPLLDAAGKLRSVMGFFIADEKLVVLRSSTFSRAASLLALRQFLRGRALPQDIPNLHQKRVVTPGQVGRDVARPAEAAGKAASVSTRDAVHAPGTAVPANDSNAVRGLLVLAVLLCLTVGAIWIWRQASTSSTMGTLVVNVEAEHIRTPYYWVYLKETAKPDRIIASRGPGGSDRAWAQPITLSVPPGKYSLQLFRSHPGIDNDSKCAVQWVPWFPNPAVTIGRETRISFGLNAESEREWHIYSGDCHNHGYAVFPGDLINTVRSRSRDCEQTVARLMEELGASQSSRPVLRESPGFGYDSGAREYDARQIRHMAKALHSGCWGWLRSHLPSASAQERTAVPPIVEQSRANIDRLYGLADRLDAGR